MNTSLSSTANSLIALAGLWLLTAAANAGTSSYKVDFGADRSPLAEGFQPTEGQPLQAITAPSFSIPDESGANPVTLEFHGEIGAYSLGKEEKPLTTDGLYTFGSTTDEPKDIGFTISGLPPNSVVSLSAVHAWDGAGRAAFLSLGESGLVDIAGDPDGENEPQGQDDFILICEDVPVGPEGKLSGIFSNSDGSTIRNEGQMGALILVVKTP